MKRTTSGVLTAAVAGLMSAAVYGAPDGAHPWSRWPHLPQGRDFFPFGVWAQNPADAPAYRALGVDFYYGLHGGPTEAQVAALRRHNMPFVAMFNDYARQNLLKEPLAWGWMHRDEPDLAHVYPRNLLKGPEGKRILREHWPEVYRKLELEGKEYDGWGLGAHPVIDIQANYRKIREADPTRPVFLQLSHAVAFEGVKKGRGDHSGNVEVYPGYFAGSDIISFDVYPVADGRANELWRVPKGLDQLRTWGSGNRPLMAIIEAGFGETFADKHQQRAQVWMAINHGATGIAWFCHRWTQVDGQRKLFSTRMPLADPQVGAAVREIAAEVKSLAAVINSAALKDRVRAEGLELDLAARQADGWVYIFAVERGGAGGAATLSVEDLGAADVEVIGENRTLRAEGGRFQDRFAPWEVHLYRARAAAP